MLASVVDATTSILREAAKDQIAAALAPYVADYFKATAKFFSFLGPFAPIAAAATVPAAIGAFNAVIPAFATGGVVGGGAQIIQVNERGQEFVVNAEATRGNEAELYRLQRLLAQGRRLRDLLPAFADGGLVGRLSSPPLASFAPASATDSSAAIVAELRATRQQLAQQGREIARLAVPRVVDARTSLRIQRQARKEATIRGVK